jgi:hypothetical protein
MDVEGGNGFGCNPLALAVLLSTQPDVCVIYLHLMS